MDPAILECPQRSQRSPDIPLNYNPRRKNYLTVDHFFARETPQRKDMTANPGERNTVSDEDVDSAMPNLLNKTDKDLIAQVFSFRPSIDWYNADNFVPAPLNL